MSKARDGIAFVDQQVAWFGLYKECMPGTHMK